MDDNFVPDGIDTPSDGIYNIHNTNYNRAPQVKSLIPRTAPGKLKPNKPVPPKPWYNGPVYIPKYIYNMHTSEKIYLHNIQVSCMKLVIYFQSHLATDITTTRPRNLAWLL